MNDMPKEIWAVLGYKGPQDMRGEWVTDLAKTCGDAERYIRADLSTPRITGYCMAEHIKELLKDVEVANDAIDHWKAAYDIVETKLVARDAALKFYADEDTYEQNAEPPFQGGFTAIEVDLGEKARAALKGTER